MNPPKKLKFEGKFEGERIIPSDDPAINIKSETYIEHASRYQFAAKYVADREVLDIACGVGYGSEILAKQAPRSVISVDISEEAIIDAERYYKNGKITYLIGDATAIPFKKSVVDAVVSFETLEHIKDYTSFILEVKRCLRPRGLFIVSTPNADRSVHWPGPPGNPFHVKEFTRNEIISLLTSHGFVIDNVFGQTVIRRRGQRTITIKNTILRYLNFLRLSPAYPIIKKVYKKYLEKRRWNERLEKDDTKNTYNSSNPSLNSSLHIVQKYDKRCIFQNIIIVANNPENNLNSQSSNIYQTIIKNTKYYYFFRGTLATHVDLYKGWVDIARKKGLPLEMVTILTFLTYIKQYQLVKHYRKFNYIHIIISPPKLYQIITFLFFFMKTVTNKQLVIHLRKQSPKPLDLLKKILKKRVKYIIELEGDPVSEKEYLIEHPYKEDFYKNDIDSANRYIRKLPTRLNKADYILTVTEELKDLLAKRYPGINIKEKTSVIPTGVDIDKIYYSENTRKKVRKELNLQDKFVIVYIGNAYYSWQNVYRTIEVFRLIKNKVMPNAFLILLIRKQDHQIVDKSLMELGISKEDYHLRVVPHDAIHGYLNAADLGVLLRHPHVMNEVASPGKFGEYLAAGLPVLTTKVVAKYLEEISKNNYGIILNDMDDDDEILEKIVPFLKYDKEKRVEISEWARRKFSTDAYAQEYGNALRKMSGLLTTKEGDN